MNAIETTAAQEELKALFSAFGKDDHAKISHALHRLQADYYGASRVPEYREMPEMREGFQASHKRAEVLWLAARAAYIDKYGHMP